MTTSQIIIFIALFVADFYISIIRLMYKDGDSTVVDGYGLVVSTIRILFLWMILLATTLTMNDWKQKANGICPEFEEIQGVYKKK